MKSQLDMKAQTDLELGEPAYTPADSLNVPGNRPRHIILWIKPRLRGLGSRVLIVLFILTLLTPMAAMELKVLPVTNYENRTLAQKPAAFDLLDCWTFFYGYEAYLDDNFAFKNSFVALNSVYKGFLRASASNQVVFGKDDWLFYTSPGYPASDPIMSYMGLNRFRDDQLAQLAAKFTAFDQKLREEGIVFFLVIPPNKHTVYAEMLPNDIRENAGESRMAQLIQYLREHTDVRIIDVAEPLIREHTQRQLYYKTDTHWNSYGAYIAYAEILKALGGNPYRLEDYEITSYKVHSKDLARMAGATWLEEQEHDFVLKDKSVKPELIEGTFDSEKLAVHTNHDPGAPSLMIYHDSYSAALMPFLTPHFSRTINKWLLCPNASEIIERAPDYVVFEILERNLEYLFDKACLTVDS
ncbi:MAG: DHHW family protein [Peptococcaceae bacterium]|nr:DHHW family protein [Peptococcaceae bacterium]